MSLTKGQILEIVNISEVKKFFYYDSNDIKIAPDADLNTLESGKSQLENLTASGIQENIDKHKLTGSGVNVGIIDTGFTYDTLNTYFSRINISTNVARTPMTEEECKNSPNEGGHSNTHGDYVASIIGANGNDFKGAVKDCNMYFAGYSSRFTEDIEWLIDKGSNVINASFAVYFVNEALNSYNSFAKWLDTIAVRSNVSFVKSSGNTGRNSVLGISMSYNSIVVGSCYNNGVVWKDTSYTDIDGTAYKPDIVAQGGDAVSPYGSAGCTSSAAPLVTAAAVQLCQYSSILMNNPVLLKAYILNGATYLGEENKLGSYEDFNAFSRDSGAGALNASKSLMAYCTRNESGGTINNSNKTITGVLYVSKAKKQVHITLCSLKNNTIIGTDATELYSVSEEPLIGFEINVIFTGSGGHTYHSCTTIDNKVSVIFTPPAKGYYKIVAHTITDVGNYSTSAALIYNSI